MPSHDWRSFGVEFRSGTFFLIVSTRLQTPANESRLYSIACVRGNFGKLRALFVLTQRLVLAHSGRVRKRTAARAARNHSLDVNGGEPREREASPLPHLWSASRSYARYGCG